MGVSQDWATHMIGHELTALHGLTHGHTLVIVFPGTLRVLRKAKGDKILQYGERVLGITSGSRDESIDEAIRRTEEIGRAHVWKTMTSVRYGENEDVTGAVAKEILKSSL